jgi:hypothetical protein
MSYFSTPSVANYCLGVIFYQDQETQMIFWDKSKRFFTAEEAQQASANFDNFSLYMNRSHSLQDWFQMTDKIFYEKKSQYFKAQREHIDAEYFLRNYQGKYEFDFVFDNEEQQFCMDEAECFFEIDV